MQPLPSISAAGPHLSTQYHNPTNRSPDPVSISPCYARYPGKSGYYPRHTGGMNSHEFRSTAGWHSSAIPDRRHHPRSTTARREAEMPSARPSASLPLVFRESLLDLPLLNSW